MDIMCHGLEVLHFLICLESLENKLLDK